MAIRRLRKGGPGSWWCQQAEKYAKSQAAPNLKPTQSNMKKLTNAETVLEFKAACNLWGIGELELLDYLTERGLIPRGLGSIAAAVQSRPKIMATALQSWGSAAKAVKAARPE